MRARPRPAPDRLEADFAEAMQRLGGGKTAIAVSGGGDSLALMHLFVAYAKAKRQPLPTVLTVDHGLRPGSSADARKVLTWAKASGLSAHRLIWRGDKPTKGTEAAARGARYGLMGEWMRKHGFTILCVAHSRDDQAETFLLRLARGSGLDGLSAMRPLSPWPLPAFPDLAVARPLLGIGRAELRAYLTRQGQPWLDDPMNADPRFDRVRLRRAAPVLAEAGLSAARIAGAANHLARAREALEMATEAVLLRACRQAGDGAGLLLDPTALAAAPRELGLRALAGLLMRVGNQAYRPRFDALERLFGHIAHGTLSGGATLHGCRIGPAPIAVQVFGPETMVVTREKQRKSSSPRKSKPLEDA